MSAIGWRRWVAATWLLALLSGCKVPAAPAHAPLGRQPADEVPYTEDRGWLFNRQAQSSAGDPANRRPLSAGEAAARDPASAIEQTSGIEPLPTPAAPGPEAVGTLLPPAGVHDPKPPRNEDDDGGFDFSNLYPTEVYKSMKKAVGLGPDEKIARAAYHEGEALYREKKYAEAATRFKTAADRWPDSPLEEDALFLLAECQFFSDQYAKALDTYATLLKKHEYSRYMDKAVARQFAIGRFWEQMDAYEPHWPVTPNFTDRMRPWFDTWGNALKAYENARLNDPTGPLADDALMATANAYFLRGRYEDAAYNYDLIRKEYPKSDHLVQSSVLGMKSKLQMYQGPMYDGKPLADAGQIADQALTQFPDRLGPEKDRMLKDRNKITEQTAQRDWAMGQYYENRRYYGAARYYYQAVMKGFPETEYGRLAKVRYEEIKDKPANPPNYFGWIESVLPSKRKP